MYLLYWRFSVYSLFINVYNRVPSDVVTRYDKVIAKVQSFSNAVHRTPKPMTQWKTLQERHSLIQLAPGCVQV